MKEKGDVRLWEGDRAQTCDIDRGVKRTLARKIPCGVVAEGL